MYHISGDVRAQKSAKRICDALIACAKKTPFSEIKVSDLYKEHLISRTTFYRLFDNTFDVLEYQCEIMAQEILLGNHGDSPREFLLYAIAALMEKREFIELLSRSGHVYLLQKMQEKYLSQSILGESMDLENDSGYFHSIMAQLLPSAMDAWVQGGQIDSPDQVYRKMQKSIGLLGKIFLE